jgi:heme exporter protein D
MPSDEDDPRSFFMNNFATLATGIHASQETTINILPLPDQGRPERFAGAVGRFDLEVTADKTNVPANSPITLKASLKGRGNFQSIDNIKIPLPQDFELYETTTHGQGANPIGARRGLDSQKDFQTIVIPRKPGNYQIPSLNWSYFDPEKKAYQTITTRPLELVVTESVAGIGPTNNYLSDQGKPEPPKTEDLRYLKGAQSFLNLKKYFLWLVYVLTVANLVLIIRLFSKKKNILQSAIQKFDPLQAAKSSLKAVPGSKNWLNDLEETVYEILEALLKTNPRALTRGELHDLWKSSGLPFELFQKIEALLATLDQQRFARTSTNHDAVKTNLIAQAEEILKSAGKIK